jgi:hypothetical protein
MSVGTNSGNITAAGLGTGSNVTIGTNTSTGTYGVSEDSTSGSGVMSKTTIGSNAGTVSGGAISGMSVGTNSGNITAAGLGTGSNVTIGTNTSTGTYGVKEDSTSGSGVMSSTTIGSNAGTVSGGAISGMSVGTNSGHITAAGLGTGSNVTIGTNTSTGTYGVKEDSTSGSGVMSSTTIGSNAGTVSGGAISGMSVGTNSGKISAAGLGTGSNVTIGTNTSTGTYGVKEDSTSGSGTMSSTTIGSNAGTVSGGAISGMSVGTNSGKISAAGQGTTNNVNIGTNTSTGLFTALQDTNGGTGTMSSTTVGSNLGTISATVISTMNVATNNANIIATGQGTDASNVTIGTLGSTGTFTATGTITNLSVTNAFGIIVAGHIGTISATNAPASSQMLKVTEAGVTRTLALVAAPGGALPNTVNYIYDHSGSGDPQLTMAVNDASNSSYDVELLSSSAAPGSGFDLAALYNAGSTPAHVRNILIEGNLTPTAKDASQIGITSSVGGIQLPGDALASVGIMGNAPAGSVKAASVQAVSFASITEGNYTEQAVFAGPGDAAALLAPGTAIVQANNTFLAAAGQTAQSQSQPVALFMDTGTKGVFDPRDVLLGNEGNQANPSSSSPVLYQVTVTDPPSVPSILQTINITGSGGSIVTAQPIASAINSSGPLGDVTELAPQGITANITAPSIFGNISAPNGPISGIIQTTAGDIGRTFTYNGYVIGTTSIVAGGNLSGQIISAGNLISQVQVGGNFTGTVAAAGNLGVVQKTSKGTFRFGGMTVNGSFNGDAVFLGNIFGDMFLGGTLNGRIFAQGAADGLNPGQQGILGNIFLEGGMSSSGALVSGGEIGDASLYTGVDADGSNKGIFAAVGPIAFPYDGAPKGASIFSIATGANLAAIDNIFTGLTISKLPTILTNLNKLRVVNGGLVDS